MYEALPAKYLSVSGALAVIVVVPLASVIVSFPVAESTLATSGEELVYCTPSVTPLSVGISTQPLVYPTTLVLENARFLSSFFGLGRTPMLWITLRLHSNSLTVAACLPLIYKYVGIDVLALAVFMI